MQLHIQNKLTTGSASNKKSCQDKYKHCFPVIVKNRNKRSMDVLENVFQGYEAQWGEA